MLRAQNGQKRLKYSQYVVKNSQEGSETPKMCLSCSETLQMFGYNAMEQMGMLPPPPW